MAELLNSTIIVDETYSLVVDKFSFLITILKAVGVVFAIYIVYLIIKGIMGWRDRRRLKKIEKKVNEIDKKVDLILSKDKKKKKKK